MPGVSNTNITGQGMLISNPRSPIWVIHFYRIIAFMQCFRDKAVELELANVAVLPCSNSDCPWEGKSQSLKVRVSSTDLRCYTIFVWPFYSSSIANGTIS